jgi:hypothetical protein
VREGDFPPKPEYVRNTLYRHDLKILLRAAELETEFDELLKRDLALSKQWDMVRDWSEESRYDARDQKAAEDMVESARGVVSRLREYW